MMRSFSSSSYFQQPAINHDQIQYDCWTSPRPSDQDIAHVIREIRSASRACNQLSHQQANAIRSSQLHQTRARVNAIVAFDRDCDNLFKRIRESYVQLSKKAKKMTEFVDKKRKIQSQILRNLRASNIDLKKFSLQYELQRRKANESGDEDQLMIQRLTDTLFEQRAQARQLRRQLRSRQGRLQSDIHIEIAEHTNDQTMRPSLRKLLLHQNSVLNNEYQRNAVLLISTEHRAEQLVKNLRKYDQRLSDLNLERQCLISKRRVKDNEMWTSLMTREHLIAALQHSQEYEKYSESLYQALFSILKCRSCNEILNDPILTSQCQHIQCRQCLLTCQFQQICSSCNALRSSKLFVSMRRDLGPSIQAVLELGSIITPLSHYSQDMAHRIQNPKIVDSIDSPI